MVESSARSTGVQTALDVFSEAQFGRSRSDSIRNDVCVFCGCARLLSFVMKLAVGNIL